MLQHISSKNIIVIIIICLYATLIFPQNNPKPIVNEFITTNNVIYFDAGRQALLSVQYERNLKIRKNIFVAPHIGIGGIPGSHDAVNFPGHTIIFTGITCLFGLNNIYAEIGIDPQIYFVRKTTFINIDGNFGLRYQNFKKGNIFLHISYTPILYTTHHNDFYIPFCFGIGECF